ncbi:acetyl-CoA carboxylase, biotin carboxyl carrier protein [Enterococcus florum]|uniref:Biotin carboxyl carrier protein of acetyl-CoA carboxylase n=1 Tax=Enterococcus florum TaxID=2480627 RepID=A0A4P5PFS0_9ENTE|nr:acetyl-CoA carboxylase biotin carboxyl carrier protein [Enterococcus florum]GCF92333.1 acetyl-CoA carboxylase, biotin carboxyl carrier protein [Enterococcus florum]
MDIKEVKELLERFDASSLTEFDLREGSFELYMNKNKTSRHVSNPSPTVEEAIPVQAHAQSAITEQNVEEKHEPAATDGEVITSPIVGVVYLQPSPDKPVFKEIGSSVKKGEIVCIIEAMKLLNEIVSEYDGTILEVLVKNEDVVEYGQPLFRIG